MDLTIATPVEIDTKLAELYLEEQKQRTIYDRQHGYFMAQDHQRDYFDREKFEAAEKALRETISQELPFEAEYERRPWQRYWHVTNVTGHIHTSQSCSSCFPDTQFGWRTDLSGLTDVQVVEREAYNACSVCMPIAPAEQRAARERYNAEQRAARKAEKDAKKEAKAVKARERAVKLVDKVEKAIADIGGRETFDSWTLTQVYNWTFDGCQSTVGDVLYEIKQTQEEGRSHHHMNEHVKAELVKRGLI